MENIKQRRIPAIQQFQLDPDNPPLSRAGAYLIRNTVNGKCYVGISQNVSRRLGDHARSYGCAPLLIKAIKKHGVGAFEAIPILYSLKGTDWLPVAEAVLILAWNALEHGYNVQAASGAVGPYGPKHGAAISASQARPDVKAVMTANSRRFAGSVEGKEHYRKLSVSMSGRIVSDETKKRQSVSHRKRASTPEAKLAASKRFTKLWTDPEYARAIKEAMAKTRNTAESKVRVCAAAKKRWTDPEMRARHHASRGKTISTPEYKMALSARGREIMARPGVKERRSVTYAATLANTDLRERMSASMIGSRWITDGVINRKSRLEGPLENGWKIGRTVGKKGPRKAKPAND